MLPSKKRLNRALFKEVLDNGKALHSKAFLLKFLEIKSEPRFSVSVSKKIAKTAVLRNKLRRRAYSALEKILKSVKDNIKGVILLKTNAVNMSFKDLTEEIRQAFVKMDLLK